MWDQFKQAFDKLLTKLMGWLDAVVLALPNLILAAIVFGVAILLSRFIKKWTLRLSEKVTDKKSIRELAANIVTIVFLMVSFFVVLGILNLDKALTSVLAGAGVLGLAVGLALQSPIVNTISGILISVRKYYNIGDLVKTNDYFGTIQHVTLRNTLIRTVEGNDVIIPNKMVIENPIINYDINTKRRVIIECGVGYESDLENVKNITKKALSEKFNTSLDEIEFFYREFGGSSINFVTRLWIEPNDQLSFLDAHSKAIVAIKKAFDSNNINIPFPIRTLDIPKGDLQILSPRAKNGALQGSDAAQAESN